jgi:hypothetical protein
MNVRERREKRAEMLGDSSGTRKVCANVGKFSKPPDSHNSTISSMSCPLPPARHCSAIWRASTSGSRVHTTAHLSPRAPRSSGLEEATVARYSCTQPHVALSNRPCSLSVRDVEVRIASADAPDERRGIPALDQMLDDCCRVASLGGFRGGGDRRVGTLYLSRTGSRSFVRHAPRFPEVRTEPDPLLG